MKSVLLLVVLLAACGRPAPQRPYELDLTARMRGTSKVPPREPTPTPTQMPLVEPPRE